MAPGRVNQARRGTTRTTEDAGAPVPHPRPLGGPKNTGSSAHSSSSDFSRSAGGAAEGFPSPRSPARSRMPASTAA